MLVALPERATRWHIENREYRSLTVDLTILGKRKLSAPGREDAPGIIGVFFLWLMFDPSWAKQRKDQVLVICVKIDQGKNALAFLFRPHSQTRSICWKS